MLTFSVPKKLISSGGKKSATEDRPTENSPEKDFLSFFGTFLSIYFEASATGSS